jgi:hypothetical protein
VEELDTFLLTDTEEANYHRVHEAHVVQVRDFI